MDRFIEIDRFWIFRFAFEKHIMPDSLLNYALGAPPGVVSIICF